MAFAICNLFNRWLLPSATPYSNNHINRGLKPSVAVYTEFQEWCFDLCSTLSRV
ncbi:MAG: hypothetical protein KBA52_07420 [Candidatus Kapabacteria bacterium]|nr:hypothetical protein [Candidatus Kapabacteria bacterium]